MEKGVLALIDLQGDDNDALLQSYHLQDAISSEGFDWPDVYGVLDKVDEEVGEIRAALAAGDTSHARKELGDLLLVAVNLSRFLGADPREELNRATRRFSNRFHFLKENLSSEGLSIKNCSLEDLETRWRMVKHEADKLLSDRA